MKKYLLLLSIFLGWSGLSTFIAQEIEHKHSVYHSMLENKGQWNKNVLFQSKLAGGNLWIQQKKFIFHIQDFTNMHAAHTEPEYKGEEKIQSTLVQCLFLGANEVEKIEKNSPTDNYYNYFIGNDKSKWVSNVRGYSEVVLKDFYDGIDMKLIENEVEMKYEFHVKPNVAPSVIQFSYWGHQRLTQDKEGNLRIKTGLGEIIEKKPYAYQIINGRIVEISCKYVLKENLVTFDLGEYDSEFELVIDPELIFATYSGSISDNFGMTATYGSDGSAFSGGMIFGNAYPTPAAAFDTISNLTVVNLPSPIGQTYPTSDLFLTKYSSDGTTMLWTTFLGGGNDTQGTETVHSLIADANDNLFCYGSTSSTDFPIQGGFQPNHAGGVAGLQVFSGAVNHNLQGSDIYVAKISANGQSLLGSTYFGGSHNDGVNYEPSSLPYNSFAQYLGLTPNFGDQFRGEIMLDSIGNCIVASCTRSTNFPVLNAIQATNAGGQDGVIFKLNSNLSTLLWSSYYGGVNNDACYSVKVDSSQNIVFAGGTSSPNLPGMNGWQSTYNGGVSDGFVTKISTNGQVLLHATYLGTTNTDQAFFIEIDRNDNVFLFGQSVGGSFPVVNANYSNPGSSQFILKLTPNLLTLLNSTVFGNGSPNLNISPSAFLVDKCGNIFISGWGANILQNSPLSGMPVTPDAQNSGASPNGFDFYLFVMDRLFSNIIYGSYLGGPISREHVDGGTSRFDRQGVVYQSVCAGCGSNSDFPVISPPNTRPYSSVNRSSNCNNLVFKFDFQTQTEAQFTVSDTSACISEPITLANTSNISLTSTYFWILPNGDTSTLFNPVLTFPTPGLYTIKLVITDSICDQSDTMQVDILISPDLLLTVTNDTVICKTDSLDLVANSFGSATSFVWSTNPLFTDTLNANPMDSVITVSPVGTQTFYVKIENSLCSKTEEVQVLILSNSIQLDDTVGYCEGETKLISVTNSIPTMNLSYLWSPSSIIIGPSNTATVSTNELISQYLYVTVSDGLGCVFTDSVWLNVQNVTTITVSASASPTSIPLGTSTVLTANPAGLSYVWSPALGLSDPTAQVTEARIDEDTEFTVFVSNGICNNSAKIKVQVYEFVCDNPFIFVPNAFSPNGDNENDILFVRGAILETVLFRVFSRWGEMVFETTSKNIGWDGTYKGKMMDPDTYDYYLKAVCIDGQENLIKGNVTLMR